MSRMRDFFMGTSDGQQDAKQRAMTGCGLALDHSTMRVDNPCGDTQAQASAVFFRGKERVEQALLRLWRNALSCVRDLQRDGRRFASFAAQRRLARAEGDGAAAGNAFGGVVHQIEQRLLELVGVTGDFRTGQEVGLELDVRLAQRRFYQLAHRLQGGCEPESLERWRGGTSESQRLTHNPFKAVDLLINEAVVLQSRRTLAE